MEITIMYYWFLSNSKGIMVIIITLVRIAGRRNRLIPLADGLFPSRGVPRVLNPVDGGGACQKEGESSGKWERR